VGEKKIAGETEWFSHSQTVLRLLYHLGRSKRNCFIEIAWEGLQQLGVWDKSKS